MKLNTNANAGPTKIEERPPSSAHLLRELAPKFGASPKDSIGKLAGAFVAMWDHSSVPMSAFDHHSGGDPSALIPIGVDADQFVAWVRVKAKKSSKK